MPVSGSMLRRRSETSGTTRAKKPFWWKRRLEKARRFLLPESGCDTTTLTEIFASHQNVARDGISGPPTFR